MSVGRPAGRAINEQRGALQDRGPNPDPCLPWTFSATLLASKMGRPTPWVSTANSSGDGLTCGRLGGHKEASSTARTTY